MKVDVEGYEYEVIFGMKKTIEKFRPKIILEFSPEFYEKKEREKRQEKLLSYLLSKYKLFSLKNKSEIKNKEKYLKQLGVKQDNIFCYVKD